LTNISLIVGDPQGILVQ